jgi:phosphatidylglycerol:prolipoprotein diacylglycerol transferase
MVYYHPTFLYESLWNLLGFVIINILYQRKKFNGQIVLLYLSWYGFGRMFIEGLRTDSLYVGSIRISQLIGFLCMVVGLLTIITLRILIHKNVINPSNDAVGAAIAASADELGDTSEESEKTNENEENKNGKDN